MADTAEESEQPSEPQFEQQSEQESEQEETPEAASFALGEEPPVDLPGEVDEEEEPKLEMDDDPGFDLSGTDFDEFGGADDELRSLDDVLAESEEAELDALAESEYAEASGSEVSEADAEPDALEMDASETDVPDAVETTTAASAPVASLPPGREPVVDPSLVDSFESDEEIVEIFVEEVDEVLENVDEWLPQWRVALESERDHEEALGEVRRAFHTLKGSGRIVGANVIGEVAWSVENMLNRLIDGTVQSGPQFVSVVEQARSLVPVLKDAFETQSPPDMNRVGQIMEMADILSSGGSLEDAAADSSADAPIEIADEAGVEEVAEADTAPQDDVTEDVAADGADEAREAFEEELGSRNRCGRDHRRSGRRFAGCRRSGYRSGRSAGHLHRRSEVTSGGAECGQRWYGRADQRRRGARPAYAVRQRRDGRLRFHRGARPAHL